MRDLLRSGVFVGLAFNTKMLEGYLTVPALGLAFLIAAPGRLRRRVAHLCAAGGAMAAVSTAWYGTMMLIPAAHRPYVGDSTNNSWFQLIFGSNGLSRVTGGRRSGFRGGSGLGTGSQHGGTSARGAVSELFGRGSAGGGAGVPGAGGGRLGGFAPHAGGAFAGGGMGTPRDHCACSTPRSVDRSAGRSRLHWSACSPACGSSAARLGPTGGARVRSGPSAWLGLVGTGSRKHRRDGRAQLR